MVVFPYRSVREHPSHVGPFTQDQPRAASRAPRTLLAKAFGRRLSGLPARTGHLDRAPPEGGPARSENPQAHLQARLQGALRCNGVRRREGGGGSLVRTVE